MTSASPKRERLFGPQITLQKLDVFCTVAELASVTRAAEWIGIAQPAVTAHVRDLEAKLGTRLVERSGRNIVLTEAGERVHRWAAEILTRSLEMRREITGLTDGTAGHAVIAASMTVGTYVLTDLVVAFRALYPNSLITTMISNTRGATEAVRTGACDFAVLMLDPEQDLNGIFLEDLWEERLLLVAAPGCALVGDSAELGALSELPYICPPRGLARRELEDDMLHAQGVLHRRVVMELGHPEAIKRAVRAGAGLAFMEETAAREEIESGALRVIATPGLALSMPLFLVHRRGKLLSEMQRRLIEFLRASQPYGPRSA